MLGGNKWWDSARCCRDSCGGVFPCPPAALPISPAHLLAAETSAYLNELRAPATAKWMQGIASDWAATLSFPQGTVVWVALESIRRLFKLFSVSTVCIGGSGGRLGAGCVYVRGLWFKVAPITPASSHHLVSFFSGETTLLKARKETLFVCC